MAADDRDEPAEPADEVGSGLPPHPLDRVWFHPSELSAYMGASEPPRPQRTWGVATLAAVFGAAASVMILAATGVLDDNGTTVVQPGLSAVAANGEDPVARLVNESGPSIVAVRVTAYDGTVTTGSGVALGRSRVITSAALAAAGTMLTLSTADGRIMDATVVGTDFETDLALLHVQLHQGERVLEPIRLGSADTLSVGETVVALGMASGDHRWTSRGVVSALDRMVVAPSGAVLSGLVETDMRPGDSVGGGALLDGSGALVGMLTRAAPGRALPIDVAREVAAQLAESGHARHGYLGATAVDAGDRPGGGARVVAVAAEGPAGAAGLEIGDVVVAVAGDHVTDMADLMAVVSYRRPGDPVAITFWRDGKRLRRMAKLGQHPTLADGSSVGPG